MDEKKEENLYLSNPYRYVNTRKHREDFKKKPITSINNKRITNFHSIFLIACSSWLIFNTRKYESNTQFLHDV